MKWREIAAEARGFPGFTELTHNGRVIAACGTGEAVKAMLLAKAEKG